MNINTQKIEQFVCMTVDYLNPFCICKPQGMSHAKTLLLNIYQCHYSIMLSIIQTVQP